MRIRNPAIFHIPKHEMILGQIKEDAEIFANPFTLTIEALKYFADFHVPLLLKETIIMLATDFLQVLGRSRK